MYTVRLDGKDFPFLFGMWAMEEFMEQQGIDDYSEIEKHFTNQRHLNELLRLSIVNGYRAKRDYDTELTKEEFLILVDNTPGVLTKLTALFWKCVARNFMGVEEDDLAGFEEKLQAEMTKLYGENFAEAFKEEQQEKKEERPDSAG